MLVQRYKISWMVKDPFCPNKLILSPPDISALFLLGQFEYITSFCTTAYFFFFLSGALVYMLRFTYIVFNLTFARYHEMIFFSQQTPACLPLDGRICSERLWLTFLLTPLPLQQLSVPLLVLFSQVWQLPPL